MDYDKGFNAVFARAYGLEDGETIAKLFGKDWGELAVIARSFCSNTKEQVTVSYCLRSNMDHKSK